MKKIVAPVDFSAVSLNAARYAAQMAAYLKLPLQLMHVTVMPTSYGQATMALGTNDELQPMDRLDQFSQKLLRDTKGQLEIELVHRVGSAVYEIMSHCNRTKAFAVILGTHGDSDITRFLLGSTTIGVIRECNSPVIVIPKTFSFKTPKRVGLASDFQDIISTTPTPFIRNMVASLGAELEVVHVANKREPLEEVVAAKQDLGKIFTTEKPRIKILDSVETEETLLNYAADEALDLLIVLPKKHSWFELIVKRQHTNNIALHATVPVMLLKNDD